MADPFKAAAENSPIDILENKIIVMQLKAVIFDLGGVIVRTEDRTPRIKLAEEFGMSYEELSDLVFDNASARLATVGKMTTQEHWETVRNTLGIENDAFSHVPRLFWAGDVIDNGLLNYLRSLRSRYKIGLLSNAWDDLRERITGVWKIDDIFDEIVISAEVGLAKPDVRIYEMAVERLRALPGEAVFVDDFKENVEAARSAGLQAIHFRGTNQVLAELDQMLD